MKDNMEIINDLPVPAPNTDGWLGFDSRLSRLLAGEGKDHRAGYLDPGQYVQITQRVQVPFRCRRMYVWQRTASDFLIHEIRLGNRSQMVSASVIPADAFAVPMDQVPELEAMLQKDKVIAIKVSQRADKILGADLHLPVAHPGMDFTLFIEHVGESPSRFVAGLVGSVPWL